MTTIGADQYRIYHSNVCDRSMSVKIVSKRAIQVKLFDQSSKDYYFRFCGRMLDEKVCQYESTDGDYIDMAKSVGKSKKVSYKYQGCTFRLKN